MPSIQFILLFRAGVTSQTVPDLYSLVMRNMAKIKPQDSWRLLEEKAQEVTNPRHKAMLTKIRDHMDFEINGQLEELLGTLTPHPYYHFWGNNVMNINGMAGVRAFYTDLIASGANQFEVALEKIVVDDENVVTEGRVKQAFTAKEILAMGITEINGEALDKVALYVTSTQLITVWPVDENGQIIGEDVYLSSDPFADCEKITPADLPEGFRYLDRM